MGLFSGIEKAEIFERGNYIVPGFDGELKVRRTLAKETMKVGKAIIVEFEVLTSNRSEHPIGSKVTWFQKLENKAVAFPAIKALVAAISGYDASQKAEIDADIAPKLEKLLDTAIANPDKNVFVGQCVYCSTKPVKTQKGLDFTRHDWSPVAE